jgi:20S proteasome alpha/beta subunit
MTLLVALKGSNGMVLASDSRGTFGDPRGVTAQNDAQQKAHILSPHVGVLVAGAGEVGALVIDLVKQTVTAQGADGASQVLEILRSTARTQYQTWFSSIPPIQSPVLIQTGQVAMRPELSFIVGGYEPDGTARIFSLPSMLDFSPMLHNYGFAVQGVAQYALYLLNRLYESDRTVEELSSLAIYVITETASQDGKVGGPVNVITIEPGNEGCRIVSPERVNEIQKLNESRSRALRDSFYRREITTNENN